MRFLDIAKSLGSDVRVVTDNDGNTDAVIAKYAAYAATHSNGTRTLEFVLIVMKACKTLEPQLLKANGREKVNKILGTAFENNDALLKHMGGSNKTGTALEIFDSGEAFTIPKYIEHAIE